MAVYKRDIVDINLETGNIHRSFLKHSIGYKDQKADHFGIRTYRDGVPVDLTGVSVQGIFLPPQGDPIAITSGNIVDGNVAEVVLPQACYNYDGQFTLSIKLVDSNNSVTGTMRIVDGMVDNTHASGTVAPTSAVPTYQEILSIYDEMVAATAAANGCIAATYSSSSTYKVGDYCIHDGGLYRCTTAITTAEAWTSGHWTAAKIGPDVSDLKSAFNATITPIEFSPTIRKGEYIKGADGTVGSGNKYARTKYVWSGYGSQIAIVVANADYEFYISYYDATNTGSVDGTGYIGYSGFYSGIGYIPSNAIGIGITFRRVDQTALSDSDITAISAALSAYAPTDTTLAKKGMSADSLAVGNRFDAVEAREKNIENNLSLLGEFELEWRSGGSGYIGSDGDVYTSEFNHTHTDYVNVSMYYYVKYKREKFTSETPAAYVAFYDKDYVLISTVSAIGSASQAGYDSELYTAYIPYGAVYARFSTFGDITTYGNFEVYGFSEVQYKFDRFEESMLVDNGSPIIFPLLAEGINFYTGIKYDSNKHLRTGTLVTRTRRAFRLDSESYQFMVYGYSEGASATYGTGYIGPVTKTWTDSGIVIIFPDDAVRVVISFRRKDGEDMSSSDENVIAESYTMYGVTDKTLTVENAAADAKIVGDEIRKLGGNFYTSSDSVAKVSTFNDVIDLYDGLVALYPEYISKNTLTSGTFTNYEYVLQSHNYNSQEGRRGQDPEIEKPTVLLVSGVHGNEQSAVMSLYAFVKSMCENKYVLNEIINSATYRIIPVACPWGYTNNKRFNANGVNINRNFDTSDWTLTEPGNNYSGAEPADQDETKVLQNWMDTYSDAMFYIDWHNSSYTSEISCFLGMNTTAAKEMKNKYLIGINKVIPWWQVKRNIDPENIYGYTGAPTEEYSNTGTSVTYARENDIPLAFTLETSLNVISTGRDSNFTIGTGEEAFANMMIEFKAFLNNLPNE